MKKALRYYSRAFIAVILLAAVGLTTLFVILSQQASALPAWFPILGEDRVELKAEFETAQAVTPGQGQTVNIAGVKVGDITEVELEDGVAVVTMQVSPEYYELLHPDATALLRPRTGLQDMTVEIDPGTEEGGIEEGSTIALASTKPNINLDQILASLDGDTRAYLKLLLAGGAEALDGEGSANLAATLRRLEPTTRDIAKINGALAQRRESLRAVITNFADIAEQVGGNDTRLAEFVSNSNTVLGAFAEQEASLRETFQKLPGTLKQTRGALTASDRLSQELGPALRELLPATRAFAPAQRELQPFLRRTTGPIKNQIRPFARKTQPTVEALKRAATPLADSSDDLAGGLDELNQLANALAYNPPGPDEGYLFYLSWVNHNTNSMFANQDSAGPLRRGLVMLSCQASLLADGVTADRPALLTSRELTRIPSTDDICPDLFTPSEEAP